MMQMKKIDIAAIEAARSGADNPLVDNVEQAQR
jgi:hypothetical protein